MQPVWVATYSCPPLLDSQQQPQERKKERETNRPLDLRLPSQAALAAARVYAVKR
jgi:hypothetical protein